jgi:hypothetical protein
MGRLHPGLSTYPKYVNSTIDVERLPVLKSLWERCNVRPGEWFLRQHLKWAMSSPLLKLRLKGAMRTCGVPLSKKAPCIQ